MGIIREVQETATNITYKIDDMTGEFVTVKVSILDPRREGPMNSVLLVSQSVSDAIPGNLVQEFF